MKQIIEVEVGQGLDAEWKEVEYTSDLFELQTKHKWKLIGADNGTLVFSRDGYINRFRLTLKEK